MQNHAVASVDQALDKSTTTVLPAAALIKTVIPPGSRMGTGPSCADATLIGSAQFDKIDWECSVNPNPQPSMEFWEA